MCTGPDAARGSVIVPGRCPNTRRNIRQAIRSLRLLVVGLQPLADPVVEYVRQ